MSHLSDVLMISLPIDKDRLLLGRGFLGTVASGAAKIPRRQTPLMQVSSSYKLIFFGVIATVLAIGSHGLLPEKRLVVYPAADIAAAIYADELSGGRSHASWVDQEQVHWRCDVREGAQHRYCGFHIDFAGGTSKGLDLSDYAAARVKLSVNSNDSRMRIYLRNFEEGFSKSDDIETAKFNNVLLYISELSHEVQINLEEFSVAEWWINERNVPREFSAPNFDNVLTVGIDLGVPPAIGAHEMKLERFEFVGEWVSAEEWYRGILFVWLSIIALVGLVRYVQIKRRLMHEQEMLKQLASRNSKLKDESEKYRELSAVDKLTGALNRLGFDQVMAELQDSLSATDEVGLLLLDLDHFKQINDSRGHDVGDRVLKKTAEAIAANIRHSDSLARWGGEEFVVLCPGITEQGALVLAEKLREKVEQLKFAEQPDLQVTTSVGVGCFHIGDDFGDVFKRVDNALYEAKRGGRNRAVRAEK